MTFNEAIIIYGTISTILAVIVFIIALVRLCSYKTMKEISMKCKFIGKVYPGEPVKIVKQNRLIEFMIKIGLMLPRVKAIKADSIEDIKGCVGFYDEVNKKIVIRGVVSEIDTSAFKEGDTIYVDPDKPGGITNINPLAKQIIKALDDYARKHNEYQYGLPLNEGLDDDKWKSKESKDILKIVSDILENHK